MNTIVERCELAPEFSISRVLTGLWQIADMERDGAVLDLEATAAAMLPYVVAGFTTFDMADHYGSAERIAGLFRYGKTVELLTKWTPKPGPVTREEVRAAVQRALDRLKSDCIDLIQFHAWNYADPRWLDCLFWLQELKQQRLIRHLGLTNFDTAHLRIVINSGIDIVCNQVCFSLLDQRPRERMIAWCQQHGIKLLCYGTVAGGFLTERWLDQPEPDWKELSAWSQMKYKRFIDTAGGWQAFQELLRAVNEVARKHGVSMANVACRYILEQPSVGGIIIGSRLGKSEHIQENLRLFQFSLDKTSRSAISAAMAKLRPIPGDCGDEYRKPPFLTAAGDLCHHLESMPPPYTAHSGVDGRSKVLSGTPWEEIAGFSRAVRFGKRICVSGTTATHGDRAIGGSDPAAQLHFVIDKIEGALHSLGARLQDVIRTRLYVRNLSDWEAVARAHGERFHGIQPANTLVQAALVSDEYLVEMEAEAIMANSNSDSE
jgi:aryl-alcohol dehydrogenase-like predicted oxidoreductase/enamine deaminase RidA (YjgF/YER057c/UK114 family)